MNAEAGRGQTEAVCVSLAGISRCETGLGWEETLMTGEAESRAERHCEERRVVVVLGLGNLLRQDEGVGLHAVRALSVGPCADRAALVDGGGAMLEALSQWREIDKLVVIDAVRAGREPGSIARVALREVAEQPSPVLAVNEQELLEGLALLRRLGVKVGEIVVYGVEPKATGWGMELSETVSACLPLLAEHVEREIGGSTREELLL
jgi:hydrogenase maturation protease